MGKAAYSSYIDKGQTDMPTRNVDIRNDKFGGLFKYRHSQYVSKMVYGWWNDKFSSSGVSSAVQWFQGRA